MIWQQLQTCLCFYQISRCVNSSVCECRLILCGFVWLFFFETSVNTLICTDLLWGMFEVALVSSNEACGWLFYISVLWFPAAIRELTVHPHFLFVLVRHSFATFRNSLSSLTVRRSTFLPPQPSFPFSFFPPRWFSHHPAPACWHCETESSLILHSMRYAVNNT